jgi:ABC-type antimicrobial peptide transport system permease subunit
LSRNEVRKYFEIRLFSLGLMAIIVFFACTFLLVLFLMRGQYLYVAALAPILVVLVFATIKLHKYGKTFRKT